MIQLTWETMARSSEIGELRHEFEHRNWIRLRGLIGTDLLRIISTRMELGGWTPRRHEGIGSELDFQDKVAVLALNLATNTPTFLKFIEDVTGCRPIDAFRGRVYRMLPGANHGASWHSDTLENRLVGMSVNLGALPFQGGQFLLKRVAGNEIPLELANHGAGDAILFRIHPNLMHMVAPVMGTEPRTAFAGWFMSGAPNFFTALRNACQVSNEEQCDH